MAYLFLGIALIIEGLRHMGVSFVNDNIVEGIALVISGIFFVIGAL